MSTCAAKFGVELAAEAAAGPVGWMSAGLSTAGVGTIGAMYLGKKIADGDFDAGATLQQASATAQKGAVAAKDTVQKGATAAKHILRQSAKTAKFVAHKSGVVATEAAKHGADAAMLVAGKVSASSAHAGNIIKKMPDISSTWEARQSHP